MLHTASNNSDSRALHRQAHSWLRLLLAVHLEAANMNQILHVSLHSSMCVALAHVSSHHLLLEIVRHLHVAQHAVEVD